ncbi:tRNA preQ1(34) S-adenosylmethionine ribosyltransferase-isomerase QueA [Patescibacteria group bacterium]|nr:tRNA preQ1(34) S-adenosylmethionine ribosyltransferase-isomerase QueA [Patescibacteria group bacterium]
MTALERLLAQYDYSFPERLIAQRPASPRDAARLLVFDRRTKRTHFSTFAHLAAFLPDNAVLVFNDTKVIPARFTVTKPTGGKAKLLYLATEGRTIRVMADRKLTIGSRLTLAPRLSFTVSGKKEKYYYLRPSFPLARLFSVLERYGTTPIPPYIKHASLSEKKLRTSYQTIFAQTKGSVAAPTASLHFTKRLLAALKKRGIRIVFVTLHVNIGTFAPLTEAQLATERLHEEYYEIAPKTAAILNAAKKAGDPVIAVGTTSARTVESACDRSGRVSAGAGSTELFIRPPHTFKCITGLITNFHVPRSSLMMLVSALVGRQTLLRLYRSAIKKRFRLFSFGDGMLLL